MRKLLIGAVVVGLAAVGLPTVAAAHHPPRHHGRHHRPRHQSDQAGSSSTTTTSTSTTTTGSGGAGTVASYSDGVLSVTLADGSTVSGKVSRFTRIRCTDASLSGGDGQGESEHSAGDGHHHADCTLAAGETVRAADLVLLPGGAVWREVIVEASSTTSTTTTTTTDSSSTYSDPLSGAS